MKRNIRYSLFETCNGYFGLAWYKKSIIASVLPQKTIKKAENLLFAKLSRYGPAELKHDDSLFSGLKTQIVKYYQGQRVDFDYSAIKFPDELLKDFTGKVLKACLKIRYGQTKTYKEIAELAGSAGACRAVGNVLAKNPLPLIIPCHRIIKSDGSIGGFTADGGPATKSAMLKLEAIGKQKLLK